MGVIDGEVVGEPLALGDPEHLRAGEGDHPARAGGLPGQQHTPGAQHVHRHDLLRTRGAVVGQRRQVHDRRAAPGRAADGHQVKDVRAVGAVETGHLVAATAWTTVPSAPRPRRPGFPGRDAPRPRAPSSCSTTRASARSSRWGTDDRGPPRPAAPRGLTGLPRPAHGHPPQGRIQAGHRHLANSIFTQLAMVTSGLDVTLVPNVSVRQIQPPPRTAPSPTAPASSSSPSCPGTERTNRWPGISCASHQLAHRRRHDAHRHNPRLSGYACRAAPAGARSPAVAFTVAGR